MKWILLLVALGLTLLFTVLVVLQVLVIGVPGEWVWGYTGHPFWDRAVFPAIIFPVFVLVLWWCTTRASGREIKSREVALALLSVLVVSVILYWWVGYAGEIGNKEIVIATTRPYTSGYYAMALRAKNIRELLEAHAERLPDMTYPGPFAHIGTHPPGGTLFYFSFLKVMRRYSLLASLLLRTVERAEVIPGDIYQYVVEGLTAEEKAALWASAITIRFLAAAIMIPVFLIAQDLYGRRAAFAAAGFTAVIPSLHLFAPLFEPVYAFLGLLFFFFAYRSLERESAGYAVLAGLTLALGFFFTIGLAVMVLMFLAVMGLRFGLRIVPIPNRDGLRSLGYELKSFLRVLSRVISPMAGGFIVPYILLYLFFGFDILDVTLKCIANNEIFYERVSRTFHLWVGWNLVDFFLFGGIPCGVLFVGLLAEGLGTGWRRFRDLDVMAAGTLFLLLFLNFSGKNLGEVARLWIFLMPFMTIAVAGFLERRSYLLGKTWIVLLVAQFAQVLAFRLSLDVLGLYTK